MKVRAHLDGFLELPQVIEDARNVVIYDDFDQPILVVQALEKGKILMMRPGDAKFRETLTSLGVGLNTEYKVMKK